MAIEDHFPADNIGVLSPVVIDIIQVNTFEYHLRFGGKDGVFVSRVYETKLIDGKAVNGLSREMMDEKKRVVDILSRVGYIFSDKTFR